VNRRVGRTLVRTLVLLVAVGLGVYAVAAQWGDVSRAVDRIGVVGPLLAFAAAAIGLVASAMSWRALLVDFGDSMPAPVAMRVFFVGQLGKYLPGGLWPVLAQMELGRTAGMRRRGIGAVAAVVLVINVTTGMVVALVCLPFTSAHALHRAWWALLLLPVGLALLHPRLLRALIDRALRVFRQDGLDRAVTWRGVLSASAWSLVMWACYGVHLLALARPLAASGHRLSLLTIGAYALAWVVGFLVVFAPAGVGAREAMLVATLSPVMSASTATAVALISRVVMTAADFFWAAIAGAFGRRVVRPDVPEISPSRS
jgi:uncharacterized membrane protein YbhN (UPF0104 family)